MADAEVVRFLPADQMAVTTQAVYLKDAFEGDWTLVPELWCQTANWNVGTSIPTATLRHRYGNVLDRTAVGFAIRAPLKQRMRWYVRVDFFVNKTEPTDPSDLLRTWTGVIEVEMDEQHGALLQYDNNGALMAQPTGRNYLIAYGWESILGRSDVDRSIVGLQKQVVQRAMHSIRAWRKWRLTRIRS
jgi:hypothetical protein